MFRFISATVLITLLLGCSSSLSRDNQAAGVATGMLKTRSYIITMYTTRSNTLYSVRTLDGTMLEKDVSIESMVARFPELEYLKDNDNIGWAGLDVISPAPESLRGDL